MMTEEKKIRHRLFIMAFAVSFLFLSIAAMAIILVTVSPDVSSGPEGSHSETVSYLPQNEDCMTVLFIGAGEKETANTFMLLRFDPVRGQIPVLTLSGSTLFYPDGQAATIAEYWAGHDAASLRDVLAADLQIPIDRYVQIDTAAFIRIFNVIGTVRYDLPTPVLYQNDSHVLRLPAGEQLLGGQAVSALIRHTGYQGGELGRTSRATDLACHAINEKLPLLVSDRAEAIFAFGMDLVQTDLSHRDYQSRIPAARFLQTLSPYPATSVSVLGSTDTLGRFSLSDATRRTIRSIYSDAQGL